MSAQTQQAAATLAQHPPAVKVAGRRMSASNKARPHLPQGHSEHASSTPASSEDDAKPAAAADDYPRPAAPGPVAHDHEHHGFEPYGKRPEHVAHEHTAKAVPASDVAGTRTGAHGAQGRIDQPAGKGLNV